MNKLDLHPSLQHNTDELSEISTLLPAISHADLKISRHLLVLVPTDLDYNAVTRRLWEIACRPGAHIQILGLCNDATQASAHRRELVTMASLLRGDNVSVNYEVEMGTNWLEAVKRNYQAGDLIVCPAEQHAGLLHRPLSQILRSNLNATVYVLSGLYPQPRTRSGGLSQVMPWVASLMIIVAAFLLQIQIISIPEGWAQTSLLMISVIGEIWLIWVWNKFFG